MIKIVGAIVLFLSIHALVFSPLLLLLLTSGCAVHLNEIQVTVNEGTPDPEVAAQSSSYGMRSGTRGESEPPTVDTDSKQSGDGTVNVNITISTPNVQDSTLPVTVPVKPF